MSVVPISGTKELASRTTNIAWRTRSDTFVLIPLLELTRAVAQHHAGFVFKITIVRKNHRAGQPRPYILVNRISLFVKRSSAGSACPDIPPQFLTLILWSYILFSSLSFSTFCSQKVAKTSGIS